VPYSYEWDFGDGSAKSNATNPVHTYVRVGSYPVTLKVTDANNNTIKTNYNAITQGDLSSCAAGYVIQSIKTVKSQQIFYNFSKIIISWTDANGVVYTSNSTKQPSTSNFSVLSVEDYDQNEQGQKTKKLRVKFNCTVFNGFKNVSIDNAEAVISVAYK
jgi:PKD repeat protein